MNAKYLILSVVVTVWASAAVAAINYGHPEPVTTVRNEATAIPRVVVTAKRIEAPVARIVVVGRRTQAGQG
jgi:hypothetical protein